MVERSEDATRAAFISEELISNAGHSRRFLVWGYAKDRPDILRSIVGAFQAGAKTPTLPDQLRFSIDGSLSAAIEGLFSAMFVVRAYTDQKAADRLVALMSKGHLETHLRGIVSEHLSSRSVGVCAAGPGENLLTGLRFAEYRFGGPSDAAFDEAAGTFATFLGSPHRQIPIAYLDFPDRWKGGDDTSWLRMVIGLPQWGDDETEEREREIEYQAIMLADKLRLTVWRSNPPGTQPGSLSERFHALSTAALPHPDPPGADTGSITRLIPVFVEGHAQPGLVARILRCAQPGDLRGGTMAVLSSHTVSTWLVQDSKVNNFIQQLKKEGLQGHYAEPDQEQTRTLTEGRQSFWLSWRCKDRPGVLLTVLNTLMKELGPDINVEREVSRVVRGDGPTCAGRMRLSVPEGAKLDFAHLEAAVSSKLEFALNDCPGVAQGWIDNPVRAGELEPDEEPWATLAFTAGTFSS